MPEQSPSDAHVIDVAMDVADLLLSMGLPATDVASAAGDVCRVAAVRRVHVQSTFNMLIFSQDGSPGAPPITQMRPIGSRPLDYGVVQQVTDGVAELVDGRRTLAELEVLCHDLMGRRRYPWWQLMVSAGLISAGVGLLFGAPWQVVVATFLIGCLGERVLMGFFRMGLPGLVAQAGAATVITFVSILGARLADAVDLYLPSEPLIIGGVVMLVVGLKFVSAFQDALDGHYVSGAAGIFRVVMLTAGIVIGILVGLWTLHQLRLGVHLQTSPPVMGPPLWQVLGAAIIAGAYAWYCHANAAGLAVSTLVGALTWVFFLWVWNTGVHEVAACGLTGILSGLLASMSARRWRIPALAITTAGIVTAVPGLRLYLGLMQAVSAPLWTPLFFEGLTTLLVAAGIGLAIAVGASLGVALGRPVKQRLRMVRALTARRRTGREPRGSRLAEKRSV